MRQQQKAAIIPFKIKREEADSSSNSLLRHELLRGTGKTANSICQRPKEESLHDIIENVFTDPSEGEASDFATPGERDKQNERDERNERDEQEESDAVNPSQLALGMTEFSDFLNLNGYAVTERDLERAFRIFNSSGGDISSEQDTVMVFQTVFCKSRKQYETFSQLFHTFLKTRQEYVEQKQKQSEIRIQRQKAAEEKEELDRQLEAAEQNAKVAMQAATMNWNAKTPVDEKDAEKMQKYGKDIQFQSSLLQILSQGKQPSGTTKADVKAGEEELLRKAAEALKNGDLKTAQNCNKLMSMLHKYNQALSDSDAARKRFLEDQTKKAESQKNKIRREINKRENLLAQTKRTQREIDEKLRELSKQKPMEDSITWKDHAVNHREEFRTTGGSVQCFGEEMPEWAGKDFKKLSEMEKEEMRRYLKENVLQFRTRLTRHIDEMDRSHIDIGKTIRGACKTGGIPMRLHYKKPKQGKTDLVLMLDISGSCKEASGMMMTFMYLLRAAFPHGSKAFCFVNSLYDVSEIMNARSDVDMAMDRVFSTIPTKGVYSDYGVPIQNMYNKYLPKITKDTILIFMGDARNNKRDPKINEFRAMCRKAKRAYWLNTEPVDEWDTADSIASLYGKYTDMFETVNPKEIIEFIANGVK